MATTDLTPQKQSSKSSKSSKSKKKSRRKLSLNSVLNLNKTKETFVLSAHGVIYPEPYAKQIKIKNKNIDVVFYTDFGGVCFATNKDPNAICHNNYMKKRPKTSYDRPRQFSNIIPEMFFWNLRPTIKSNSGVKRCSDNYIIMNFDDHNRYPDKIMPWDLYAFRPYKILLSEVINYIEKYMSQNFELHILTCLELPHKYHISKLPVYS